MNGTPARILVVDDEPNLRDLLESFLVQLGYEVETARDGIEALAKIDLDFDLMFLDLIMPGMDGYEVIQRVRENPSGIDLPIIVCTGLTGSDHRLQAIEMGANDIVLKPFDFTEIRIRAAVQLRVKSAFNDLRRKKDDLEAVVTKRTQALRKSLDDVVNAERKVREAYIESIYRLVIATEYSDSNTGFHIQRMSKYSALIGRTVGLSPGDVETILHASPMHDIGKIGTPQEILSKPGKLTDSERRVIQQHTMIGSQILINSSAALLQAGSEIALSHHERWDGKGYPHRLAGEEIPVFARISAVADVFDALTTERPYKPAISNDAALMLMKNERGHHFDPVMVDAFLDNFDEVEHIQRTVMNNISPIFMFE